ncbi:MAG: P-II family nitrogen regulator [Ruminiclostridium sp.]|nr:P-II family nitrogen regulator [Ruminiclostridium sp.]MBQ8410288.1 P-II family nitrogen regulator [Ruminiclostridium sp.]MBQ8842415.1 P-II family nitrogen regulator [Ruminiclostridium sp.]
MLLVKAIVRPEKSNAIIDALYETGFTAITKMDVSGRGKQKGTTTEAGVFDELPKTLLYIVCEDKDKDTIVEVIMKHARTGEHGDGRIFVSAVEEAYTISTGEKRL